jgi:hypothetical protein
MPLGQSLVQLEKSEVKTVGRGSAEFDRILHENSQPNLTAQKETSFHHRSEN